MHSLGKLHISKQPRSMPFDFGHGECQAKGGGIERYPLNAIRTGPHDQPCPCGF